MKLLSLLALLGVAASPARREIEITVAAGNSNRVNVPIRVPVAAGVTSAALTDPSGSPVPSQVTSASELVFILAKLEAGKSATFKAALTVGLSPNRVKQGYSWQPSGAGDFTELSFESRPVLRYMHKPLDESSKQAREESYKVFHHLYDPAGKQLVTKGPGGQFTHHRGIFYGFNKTTYGAGKNVDIWHCTKDTHQAHEKLLSSDAGPVLGRHAVQIAWRGEGKEVFARERRELTVYSVPGGQLLEFASELTPVIAPIKLDGDPQHAGFHFRAANEVDAKKTYFLRPSGKGEEGKEQNWPGNKQQVNLPWNAMSFVLGDQRYTCAYLDHPQNPKEARFSERTYGRFGSYFVHTVEEGKPLVVRYRLWLQEGELKAEETASKGADFTDPPKVTVK